MLRRNAGHLALAEVTKLQNTAVGTKPQAHELQVHVPEWMLTPEEMSAEPQPEQLSFEF